MTEVVANGIRLYYEEHGEGTPILGIHGSGSSALMWAAAVEPFGRARSSDPLRPARTHAQRAAGAVPPDDTRAGSGRRGGPARRAGRRAGRRHRAQLRRRRRVRARAPPSRPREAIVGLEPGLLHLDPEAKRLEDDLSARLRAADPERVGQTLIEVALGPGGWEALPAEARELFTANGPAILAEVEGLNADLDEAALSAIEHQTLLVSAAGSPEPFRRVAAKLASLLPNVEEVRVEGGHLIDPAGPEVLRFVERFA